MPYWKPDQKGNAQLYFPNLLFGPSTVCLPKDAFPNYNGAIDQPPFPITRIPQVVRHQIHDIKFIALVEAHERLAGGITKTAAEIQDIPLEFQLKRVRRCNSMWNHCWNYVLPQNPKGTWGHGQASASLGDQALAISSLAAWYQDHTAQAARGSIPVNSHEGIADQVKTQILQPLEYLLHTRYHPMVNRGTNAPGRYPLWGRPSRTYHRNRPSPDAAGHPDFALWGIGGDAAPCHLEVKSWAAYEDRALQALYTSQSSVPGSGEFEWEHPRRVTIAEKIAKQIWGQMYFYTSWFGICTNGRFLFIYVKTSQNDLILSSLKPWTEPGLLKGLFGLCCASIDGQLSGNPEHLVNILAPPSDLESNWNY